MEGVEPFPLILKVGHFLELVKVAAIFILRDCLRIA